MTENDLAMAELKAVLVFAEGVGVDVLPVPMLREIAYRENTQQLQLAGGELVQLNERRAQ